MANLAYANTAILNGDRVVVEVFGEAGHEQIGVDKAANCDRVSTEPL